MVYKINMNKFITLNNIKYHLWKRIHKLGVLSIDIKHIVEVEFQFEPTCS